MIVVLLELGVSPSTGRARPFDIGANGFRREERIPAPTTTTSTRERVIGFPVRRRMARTATAMGVVPLRLMRMFERNTGRKSENSLRGQTRSLPSISLEGDQVFLASRRPAPQARGPVAWEIGLLPLRAFPLDAIVGLKERNEREWRTGIWGVLFVMLVASLSGACGPPAGSEARSQPCVYGVSPADDYEDGRDPQGAGQQEGPVVKRNIGRV